MDSWKLSIDAEDIGWLVFDVPDKTIQSVYQRIPVGDELYTFVGSG